MKTFFFESIYNTQEFALSELDYEPVLVISFKQEQGKGTAKRKWLNADQALACSLAINQSDIVVPTTLIPLIASYIYISEVNNVDKLSLKWPNDITLNQKKVGGVLVEKINEKICIGIGVNYFWKKPEILSAGSIYLEKQDNNMIKNHGEVWGEILISTLKLGNFDIFEYKKRLTTLNKLVEYPDGRGWVQDVNPDGSLSVKTINNEIINLVSPLISELN
ncbi:MAG: hypothetical protein O3A48_02045 [Actinomycetota bacterium]|nr:hypothetical protein [Actinomycetota bacterium]MDA3013306.1 hypothetical protein [Actinomycetota bacterium]